MQKLIARLLCLALAAGAGLAHAAYPERPITLVAPFPPGGTSDALARHLAKGVSESLGVPVIVENKPGAEGQLAAQDVAKAAPDGYRIALATSGNLSALPSLRKDPPYDSVKDFTPVADIGRYAFFLFVHPEVPARTFQEFVDYTKANPGKVSYGTGNNTGILAMAQVASMFGLDMLHVRYKGEPPATLDLVANRVQAMIGTAAGLSFVQKGELRALVALLPQRSPLAPDVPLLREAGLGDLPVEMWAAIVGPAGMPADVVVRLNRAFNTVLEDPAQRAQIEALGFALTPSQPQDLAKLLREQAEAYRKLIGEIGMPVQ